MNYLKGVTAYGGDGLITVGDMEGVAEIYNCGAGEVFADLFYNGNATDARVEDTHRAVLWFLVILLHVLRTHYNLSKNSFKPA